MKTCPPRLIFTALAAILGVVVMQMAHAQKTDPKTVVEAGGPMAAGDATNANKTAGLAIFLTEIPEGYRDWKLISMSRLTTGNGSNPSPDTPPTGSQLRAKLGNDIALKAYREGRLPFPDGAIIAAIHWNEASSQPNDEVLAEGFPGAGIQSFVPGPRLNLQFMVKDSNKFAATGGWGFGDFTDGKPGNAGLMKTCFACHVPAKEHDFVFTRYAP